MGAVNVTNLVQVSNRPCIREYRILGINKIVQSIPNFLGANVTVEFHLDEFGMVGVKKAELNSKYLSKEGTATSCILSRSISGAKICRIPFFQEGKVE